MSQQKSEQETTDLENFKKERAKLYDNYFLGADYIINCSPEMLKHTGHKTIEEAILYRTKSTMVEVQKLLKKHLAKYPD